MKNQNRKIAAFFDLDLTLTQKDSFRSFMAWFYLRNASGWIWLPTLLFWGLMRKLRMITHTRFMEKMLSGMAGMDKKGVYGLGKNFFNEQLKNLLRPKGLDRVRAHQARGDKVFIVSGAPDIYVGAVSRFLGCDGYACTILDMDNGPFTGKILGSACLAHEKPGRLKAMAQQFSIDLKKSVAYSDHESDLPFFAFVGQGVAVSPTPVLARVARARGWPVLFW